MTKHGLGTMSQGLIDDLWNESTVILSSRKNLPEEQNLPVMSR